MSDQASQVISCSFHLLSLDSPRVDFFNTLAKLSVQPILAAEVIHWVLPPQNLSPDLVSQDWDVFLTLKHPARLPQEIYSMVQKEWSIQTNVPAPFLANFSTNNHRLLHPQPGDVPPLTGSLDRERPHHDDIELQFTADMEWWMRSFHSSAGGSGAVTMVNLLTYEPGKREVYMGGYTKAFAETFAASHGVEAKLVGFVDDGGASGWEDVGLVHYPSVLHFADLVASDEYVELDRRYKGGVIRDTCILCVKEVEMV